MTRKTRKFKDLVGIKFGRLLVLKKMGQNKYRQSQWLCKCDCGNEKMAITSTLNAGHAKSCGCLRKEYFKSLSKKFSDRFIELKGKKFGRLTVLEKLLVKKHNCWMWKCKCDCGKETKVRSDALISGQIKSCGCLRFDNRFLLPKGEAAFNYLYTKYKQGAIARKLVFEIDKEHFAELVKQDCYYCKAKPKERKYGDLNGGIICNGADRLDNNKGYILDNVVPCCSNCNWAKRDMSLQKYKEWIERSYHTLFPSLP